jgi:lipopolysaccharide/colanic/teichoic acid biosynthesis glycosyltransferase
LIPLLGLIIKSGSKGPIFFIQKREGYRGKLFECIKFRTMIVNEESDTTMADDNDKRLTKFGKFLRLSTIDEMPQFINVFFGDMSIVGPRPHPIKLNAQYSNKILKFNKRHRYKPGITGLSQISGYSGFISSLYDMNKRVKTDILYFKNWSFFLDLKIIYKTFLIMVRGVFKLI